MTKILELDPSNDQARRTIIRLKPLADEKREKMKEEMIGKLKSIFFCMWFYFFIFPLHCLPLWPSLGWLYIVAIGYIT